MKLIITRHWETSDNLIQLLTGQKDVELTDKWRLDAELLSEKLINFDIDIIYCSNLKRAKDTISPYLQIKEVNIIYTDEMLEMDFGTYNWASEEEAKEERSKWIYHKIGQGESLFDLYNRAFMFLEKIKLKHKNETVLLIWHNAINRNIIGIIKWLTIDEITAKKERFPHVEILEFEI